MEDNINNPQRDAAPEIPPRKAWPIEGRDRRILPISFALGFLVACVLVEMLIVGQLPGLGTALLAAGWYVALFLGRGTAGMERKENRWLMAAAAALSLTLVLFSNPWFRRWNHIFLILLLSVHTWELCGGVRLPWHRAGMLAERLGLMISGCFARLGALRDALSAATKQGKSRWLPVLAGIALACPVLLVVTSVLMDADAFFALVAEKATQWLWGKGRLSELMTRLILALIAMPFLFSLLYFAAHPAEAEVRQRQRSKRDSLPAVILLGALDALYLFFIGVQSAALFGGADYLAKAGISFAEYARSGFFQLVGLAGLNIGLILLVVWLCREDRWLRWLSTALVALTAVLLVSALWRMSLYVAAYGLSFKRFLTYWGMIMLAIGLILTLRKIWREDFSFFRAAAPILLAGWLVLNYCNVDGVVAACNAARVKAGDLPQSAVDDLIVTSGGYDSLYALRGTADEVLVQWHEDNAAWESRHWVTWNLSAQLHARK